MNPEQRNKRQLNVAWFAASSVFIVMEIWGIYGSHAIRDANGQRPPALAVCLFTLIVIALLRPALRHHFKTRGEK